MTHEPSMTTVSDVRHFKQKSLMAVNNQHGRLSALAISHHQSIPVLYIVSSQRQQVLNVKSCLAQGTAAEHRVYHYIRVKVNNARHFSHFTITLHLRLQLHC